MEQAEQPSVMDPNEVTHYDLPSPYQAHACGLLHLPRFIAKIRKHLQSGLLPAYQRNFTKGFDGFLCLHLGLESQVVIDIVRHAATEDALNEALYAVFPEDLKCFTWNRKLCQMGMSVLGQEKLDSDKAKLGIGDRQDIRSYADIIDYDEGRVV